MEKINITFLGTGNAIPTEKRNHTGILVSFANENILFDCGEGIQRQFRIGHISPSKITRIFITHWHGDHFLGLPGLFQTLAMSNYQKTLKIYGPSGTKRFISIFKELLISFNINLEVHELSNEQKIDEKDFYIESMAMSHGIPTLAYSLILKDKIRLNKNKIKKLKLPNSPLIGQLQSGKDIIFKNKKIKASSVCYTEKGKKLSIILDTKMNKNAIILANSADLLIAESTFSAEEKEKAKEYNHLSSVDAATIAKEANSKSLILTHISQKYEHNFQKIEKEARKIFKKTKVVRDFDIAII